MEHKKFDEQKKKKTVNDRKKETVMEEKLRLKPSLEDVNDKTELRMHLHVDVSHEESSDLNER